MLNLRGPLRLLAVLLAFSLLAAACSDDDDDGTAPAAESDEPASDEPASNEPLRIAFFASSSENGYNQAVYDGVERAAAEAVGVETEIFNGEFDAELQFNQIEDIVTSGRFDGYVIVPNDPVGITPAAQVALNAGPTATALFPIGPDLETLEPQLEGMITTAGVVTVGAARQAELVVEFCEDFDPCRVVILIGFLQFPFDGLRLETYEASLGQHDNIEVVSLGEGAYSQDVALTAMQDILQANPEFEVLLSGADQHVTGALVALADAGIDPEPLYISGLGASKVAIDGIRAGIWDATGSNFPATEGYLGAKNVIAELRGEPVNQVNDVYEVNELGVAVITAADLDANPDWVAEWAG